MNRRIEKSGNEKLAAIDVRSFVVRNSKKGWREPAMRWSIIVELQRTLIPLKLSLLHCTHPLVTQATFPQCLLIAHFAQPSRCHSLHQREVRSQVLEITTRPKRR